MKWEMRASHFTWDHHHHHHYHVSNLHMQPLTEHVLDHHVKTPIKAT